MRTNLPFLLAASNVILKPGGLLKWKKRLMKDARLSLPLTEVINIARLTSPLPGVPRLSLPSKAKAETWQTTRFSLSPKSNPKFVYSLLRSGAGSSSSSSCSSNFSNCSSSRESIFYASSLRSHFSVSQPKALRSRARGKLYELRRATCPEESHPSFCSYFSSNEFLAAASNLSSSTATGPDKAAYPMLKHFPRFGMDFLLHIFSLSWTLHSFSSIWKTSFIIPIYKMGKPLDSSAYLSHLLRIKAF